VHRSKAQDGRLAQGSARIDKREGREASEGLIRLTPRGLPLTSWALQVRGDL